MATPATNAAVVEPSILNSAMPTLGSSDSVKCGVTAQPISPTAPPSRPTDTTPDGPGPLDDCGAIRASWSNTMAPESSPTDPIHRSPRNCHHNEPPRSASE